MALVVPARLTKLRFAPSYIEISFIETRKVVTPCIKAEFERPDKAIEPVITAQA